MIRPKELRLELRELEAACRQPGYGAALSPAVSALAFPLLSALILAVGGLLMACDRTEPPHSVVPHLAPPPTPRPTATPVPELRPQEWSQFAVELEAFLASQERIRRANSRNPCVQQEEVAAVTSGISVSLDKMESVLTKYRSRFRRYPNHLGSSYGIIYDYSTPGRLLGQGIIVTVEEVVDPATLAESKRLPACLDGVPVWVQKIPRASRPLAPRPTTVYQEAGDND